MASTYTINSGVEKITNGEQAGTWGTTTNNNLDIIDRAINGVGAVPLSGTTHDLTTTDGTLSEGGYKVLVFTGALGANNTVTIGPNDQAKLYLAVNSTTDSGSSGPYNVIVSQGTGANATILNGEKSWIYADGGGSDAIVAKVSTDILNDTSPQLGGNLDTNGKLIKFGDAAEAGTDDTLEFGASDDMQLYHDATNSYITNKTGALKIATETSGIAVTIGHTTSETTIADNVTVTGNSSVGGNASVGDNLSLASDGAILNFGVNSDVNITHVHDTGLLINDARELRFRDDALKILSSADGQLDIDADTELELTAPTVQLNVTTADLNGNLDVSGTSTLTGNVTLGGQLIMPDVTSTKILVADGTSYQEVAVSGDITIANTGAVTIAANAVEASMLASTIGVVGMWSKVAVRDTAAITDSLNTSGITDNSVGDFTIAINANLGDANYGVNVTTGDDDGTNRNVGEVTVRSQAAGTVQIQHFQATPSESSQRGSADCDIAYVSCFDN